MQLKECSAADVGVAADVAAGCWLMVLSRCHRCQGGTRTHPSGHGWLPTVLQPAAHCGGFDPRYAQVAVITPVLADDWVGGQGRSECNVAAHCCLGVVAAAAVLSPRGMGACQVVEQQEGRKRMEREVRVGGVLHCDPVFDPCALAQC